MRYESDELFEYIITALREGKDFPTIEKLTWSKFGTELAVLSIDSTSFTHTTKKHGIATSLTNLCKMYMGLRPIFEKHGAVTFRVDADNLFSEFDTVDQALAATIDSNRVMHELEIQILPGKNLEICSGIGYGYLLQSERKGAFGPQMNLASKLGEDIAVGSEILLTEEAFNQLSNHQGCVFNECSITMAGVTFPYYQTKVEPQ
jgi:class 3 adenylate cyclase